MSLSKRQRAIYDFIVYSTEVNGFQPSLREIGSAIGLASVASVNYQLVKLEEAGLIQRLGKHRTLLIKGENK